ncbi:MAG: CRTAC1 family protein [candidate division WOR-3 bacterium]
MESPEPFSLPDTKLGREEWWLRRAATNSAKYFVIGFVSSKNMEDRRKGVELAEKHYRHSIDSLREYVKNIRLANPMAQAQITRLIMDESLFAYSLVESGLAVDAVANPFLKEQPNTTIRFEPVNNTGLEDCELRIGSDSPPQTILGDYDNDGYADLLIPGGGLWRNLGGSGKFKRVDEELGLDINGTVAAFADVNNDGLVDVVVAGEKKFGVSLQTNGRIFRPLLRPSNRVPENPAAIGLFDGDGDGLIDVYLASSEKDGVGRTEVFRNKGDGTFEDVANAWGFSGDDVLPVGHGVSPGDYDNDGRTDIFVANSGYPNNRNTLWRNVSEGKKAAFIQCAAAPWFGADRRPEPPEGLDRGVEGLRTVWRDSTFWGQTPGAVWGDLNEDGTMDLVCANFSHPRYIFQDPPFIMDLSRVYLNTGHSFEDHTLDSGLVFRETSADPLLADFNNDGHLDLSIINTYRIWVNQLYEGVGDGSFREVTFRTGAFAANVAGQAAADFDNDGDLDWFVFDGNKGLLLYENKLIDKGKTPASANWIELRLHGRKQVNGMAYGARVTVRANGRSYIREIAGMRGRSNCDDQVVHVGLGEYGGKVNVEVRWIGDRIQDFSGLDVNKRHQIYEAEEKGTKQ